MRRSRIQRELEVRVTLQPHDVSTSIRLFDQARELLPRGVSSPVRAFRAVGGRPLFIERGEGAYIFDADGNRYVDYVLSWGPLILGHAHPSVVEALNEALLRGTSYGAPSGLEIQLANKIQRFMPSIEMLRFVNSGTEATMRAHVEFLSDEIFGIAAARGVPVYQTRVGPMFSTFFTEILVQDWESAQSCDLARFASYFQSMLSAGIYIAPSQFESGFISTMHDESTSSATLEATQRAFGN